MVAESFLGDQAIDDNEGEDDGDEEYDINEYDINDEFVDDGEIEADGEDFHNRVNSKRLHEQAYFDGHVFGQSKFRRV